MAYDTAWQKATRAQRLPNEAAEVLEEIKAKLRQTVYETAVQKQERVDKLFDALQMGRDSHSVFKAKWEALLDEMENAGFGNS